MAPTWDVPFLFYLDMPGIHLLQSSFWTPFFCWLYIPKERLSCVSRTASAPVYENRGGQKRSEGALKQPVPPPNKPAPLAKSESMKESSGGLTSRYMGHPDSSQNNCSQLPFPLPSEREPSGTAASTTIKNAQQPSSNQNAAVYQNNSNSDGCGSNKDKMEILDYDHTLRAIGSSNMLSSGHQGCDIAFFSLITKPLISKSLFH